MVLEICFSIKNNFGWYWSSWSLVAVHHLPVSWVVWCVAEVTFPKTEKLLHIVPGSRPAAHCTQTSSTWEVEDAIPSCAWQPRGCSSLSGLTAPLLFVFLGQTRQVIRLPRVQASDTGHQINDTYGCECPYESQFPGSFNWGEKIPWGRSHMGIVISKAPFSEIKHFSPVV